MKKLLFCGVFLSGISFAQTSSSIVNRIDSPVRIISVLSKPNDMLAEVTLHNSSGRNVVRVRLGLILAIPAACGPKPYVSEDYVRDYKVNSNPDLDFKLSDIGMAPTAVIRLKELKEAYDVISQVTVVGLTYSDGEEWKLERSDRSFDDQLMAKFAEARCPRSGSAIKISDGGRCAKGSLRLARQGYDGGYYTCIGGTAQYCTNNGAASCLNTACTDKTACANQVCEFVPGGKGGPPVAPPKPSATPIFPDSESGTLSLLPDNIVFK